MDYSNINTLSAKDIIILLEKLYVNAINKNIEFKNLPAVMLWGPPGVGKSSAIYQLKDKLENQTSKKVVVTDIRLLLFNPIDLRGIPVADQNKEVAIWLKPSIFNMNPSDDYINILFLDEISAAPQSVQAAAYQLTLDRRVGEHKLPNNCIVISAGNRSTDKSTFYQMPKALANRFMHINIESDFEAWNEWAVKNQINPMVLSFLKFKPDYLMSFDPKSTDVAFPTPRSWHMVSNVLNTISENVKEVMPLISGLIGSGVAIEFRAWSRVFKGLPNIDDIFLGKCNMVPNEPDVLYALISSIIFKAKTYKDDLFKIENSINYAMKLPADFSFILLKDYLSIDDNYKNELIKIPLFKKWLTEKGKLLNGII